MIPSLTRSLASHWTQTLGKGKLYACRAGHLEVGRGAWTKVGDVTQWGTEDGPRYCSLLITSADVCNHTTRPHRTTDICECYWAQLQIVPPTTKCCRDPLVHDDDGACFKVSSCAQIHTGAGGLSTSEPFHLVRMDLKANAAVSLAPPLCTMKAQGCPWSLEII